MARGEFKANDAIVPRRVVEPVTVPGAAAATAANYGVFFIADKPYEVMSVRERHETAGTDASAVSLMVKKVASGAAPADGANVLAAGLNLKGTANTVAAGSLHGTLANRRLDVGDALALVPTGTLTALAGVAVTVELKRV